jgi:protein-S-isoprenylcysteine O-methyltransferase Ste14
MAELIRLAERLFLIPLSVMVIVRIAPQLPQHPHLALFLVSEIVGVVLLLIQRRGEWSVALYPFAVAFVGTAIGLMVAPGGVRLVGDPVSLALMLVGGSMSLAAKLSLGRSFGIVPANRGVKRAGIYRFVRHPMYAGYILNQLAFLLVFCSAWNVAIYAGAWIAFWLRAVEEEKFLRRDPAYDAYAGAVKYRLIPGIA